MTDQQQSEARGPRPDPKQYRTIPALAAYIDRVGAEQRNFRRFVITQERGGYRAELAVIKIGEGGTIAVKGEEFQPTEEEAAAIKEAFVGLVFPKSIPASMVSVKELRLRVGATDEDWFVLLDDARKAVSMCQQRIEKNDKKEYLPWTYWSDAEWRRMEPDGGLLPLWKPMKKRHTIIMLHEGAKAARYCDWLCYSDEEEAKAARAIHPWAAELAGYDHWGWIGGAPNPQRTDWSEILRAGPSEIVVVADNDANGKRAISGVSFHLQIIDAPVLAIRFDDGFPPGFDLADPFPEKMWLNGRYRGPHLADCCVGATWATKVIPRVGPGA
jgi:hypothetical protein